MRGEEAARVDERFSRTERLLGAAGMARLQAARVAIFGIGGVGSFAAEGLARAGVGFLRLVDGDAIDVTNINRQIHALTSTVGQNKAEAMKTRIFAIHPEAEVEAVASFYRPEAAGRFLEGGFDYVVDAVDMVTAKISLIEECQRRDLPIISSMGAGNKLDPAQFQVADIYSTRVCPLAKILRRELSARGVTRLKVVYSPEPPVKAAGAPAAETRPASAHGGAQGILSDGGRKRTLGSVSFVPSVAGLILAGEVVRDLIGREKEEAKA
ncbi:MAG: tRNA threonylcarbamoyladenosine dehydratase [Schwartzia sp. (in: firmicutes)]